MLLFARFEANSRSAHKIAWIFAHNNFARFTITTIMERNCRWAYLLLLMLWRSALLNQAYWYVPKLILKGPNDSMEGGIDISTSRFIYVLVHSITKNYPPWWQILMLSSVVAGCEGLQFIKHCLGLYGALSKSLVHYRYPNERGKVAEKLTGSCHAWWLHGA